MADPANVDDATVTDVPVSTSTPIDKAFFAIFPPLFLLYCAPGLAVAYILVGAPWSSDGVSGIFKALDDPNMNFVPVLGGIILLPLSTYYSLSQKNRTGNRMGSVAVFYFFFSMFLVSALMYIVTYYFGDFLESYNVPDLANPPALLVNAHATAKSVVGSYVKEFLLYTLTVLGASKAFDTYGKR